MAAFSLSLAVFGFWWFLGWAMLAALDSRRAPLHNLLLAPAVGAACTVLPVFWVNRLGAPVRWAGPLVSAGLLVVALVLLRRRPEPLPVRRALPFAAVLVGALLLAGHPLLRFGFDWLSYGNDDMANYVLAAHRFFDHGFFAVPDTDALLRNRDTSLHYWFMHAVIGDRPGSELLLAWLMSLARRNGLELFMPLILSLHLTGISAAGALVCRSSRTDAAPLLTCLLVALSSLATLGVVYQLLAQTFGLALLAAAAALVLPPRPPGWRQALPGGVVVAAMLVVYPEVFPFLALAFGLSTAVGVLRRRLLPGPVLAAAGAVALTCVVLLNRHLATVLVFLWRSARKMEPADLQHSLFPFFLIPSGLANFWGLVPLNRPAAEPLLSIAIAGGLLLLLLAGAAAMWQAWLGQPAGALATVMLATALYLFLNNTDFGLFKMAMYLQPFVLGAMVGAWLRLVRRWT